MVKGSLHQIRYYVNREPSRLEKAMSEQTGIMGTFQWVSPLEPENHIEYKDGAFLEKLGLAECKPKLKHFWPRGGPNWDALAVVKSTNKPDQYLLIEGKSYPDEMKSTCQARTKSKALITQSLDDAKSYFGVDLGKDWLTPYYQYCNRLAHLYFLREICGKDAWLINLCFLNDTTYRGATLDEWNQAISDIKQDLGLNSQHFNLGHVKDVFLDAVD